MGDDAYDVRLFSDAAAKKVFTTYLNRSMIENKVRQRHRETHSKLTHVALACLRRRADVDDVECAVNAAALVAWVERTSPHSEAKCSWLLVHSPTAMRGNGATSCAVRAVHRSRPSASFVADSPACSTRECVGFWVLGLRYFVDSSIDTCTLPEDGESPAATSVALHFSYNPRTWDAGEHAALATRVAERHFPERLPLKYAAEASARAEPLPAQAESPPATPAATVEPGDALVGGRVEVWWNHEGGGGAWYAADVVRHDATQGHRLRYDHDKQRHWHRLGRDVDWRRVEGTMGGQVLDAPTGMLDGEHPPSTSSPDAPPASSAGPAAGGKRAGQKPKSPASHSSPDSSGGGSKRPRGAAPYAPGTKVKMVWNALDAKWEPRRPGEPSAEQQLIPIRAERPDEDQHE